MSKWEEIDVPSTLEALHEGFQIVGFDWRYLYVNDAVARQGRKQPEELLGRTMMECYPGIEDTPLFVVLRRCMSERVGADFENDFVHERGDQECFELRIRPCAQGLAILSLDVTKRKALESTLRQAQKMDAIGKLAAGVAHDFNNLLTIIVNYGAFLHEDLPPDAPEKKHVDEILAASDRAAKLTRQILTFSRQQVFQPVSVDLNRAVRELQPMLQRLLPRAIQIRTALTDPLSSVSADPNGMDQVLINLVVNARDAMPDGGEITIETREVDFSEAVAESHANVLSPGRYVMLSVSDPGIGMSRDVQERIFEPFFTTKAAGTGTGLGLATCYGIVRQAGGFIWVYSEPGHGSTFKVYLPRRAASADAAREPLLEPIPGGDETVLAVDDDEALLEAIRRTLERAGYRVLTAASADEANTLALARKEPVDLLLSDLIVPNSSGLDLSKSLLGRWPHLRILYVSGFTEASLANRIALSPGSSILEKPFTPDVLLRSVREALPRRSV